jgi:hypothetical protein
MDEPQPGLDRGFGVEILSDACSAAQKQNPDSNEYLRMTPSFWPLRRIGEGGCLEISRLRRNPQGHGRASLPLRGLRVATRKRAML